MKDWHKKIKIVGGILFVTAAYVAAGKLGLLFAFVQANATAIWAPTGIAITVLLLWGYEYWPALFIGAFITNITTAGTPIAVSLGIAAGNTCEALIAVYLVNRFANGPRPFYRPQDVLRYSFFAGLIATAGSATIGAISLSIGGLSPWAHYGPVWLTWWLGDMGGALIVAPLLILWLTDYRVRWNNRKAAEAGLLAIVLFIFGFLVIIEKLTLLFIFMTPIFIWVAFRFDRRTMATALFVTTEVFTISTLASMPAANTNALNTSLILLQAFMATNFAAMMALAASIAEEKNIEMNMWESNEELVQEKAQHDAIFSSIGDGLVVTDPMGKIIFVNPAAEDMFGWTRQELIGEDINKMIPVEDEKGTVVPLTERPIGQVLAEKKAVNTMGVATYYYVRKNKTRFPVALSATPYVVNGRVQGIIDLIKDITAEKESDREKSEFISIAAHQLRTPLSSIKWLIELLLEDKVSDAQHKKLAEIYLANERLINIVRNLLDITKIESGRKKITLEPLDLKAMVTSTIKLCEHEAVQKRLSFSYAASPQSCIARADRILFTEAIKNILDNAIVYAPPASAIPVKIEEQGGSCLITIENEGPAISEADRPNIFKKFYRGVEASHIRPSGSGLGLYIAKLNIENMGGNISFESPVRGDGGVAFHISMPVQPS